MIVDNFDKGEKFRARTADVVFCFCMRIYAGINKVLTFAQYQQ